MKDESSSTTGQDTVRKNKNTELSLQRVFLLIIFVFLLATVLFIVRDHKSPAVTKNMGTTVTASATNPENILGKVIMSEALLKATVKAQNLTIYWAGPIVGDSYALLKTASGINLYYLDKPTLKTSERIVSTYPLANAYALTLARGKLKNSLSFTNIDGNAVYYSKASTISTKHVYVGIKKANIQVEIFDPRVDQSLAIAISSGGVSLVQ